MLNAVSHEMDDMNPSTHMSVMFSISASLCRTGNALMPRSGSTQEILLLLHEQDEGQASADIHGSPEPTVTPIATTHHQKHRPGAERAALPALQALMLHLERNGPAQIGGESAPVRL